MSPAPSNAASPQEAPFPGVTRVDAAFIRRRLAQFGLGEGPLRVVGVDEADEDIPRASQRLADALASLGGLYAVFGRYLANRLDVLTGECCESLLEISLAAPPAPIERCFPSGLPETWTDRATVNPRPFASTWLDQRYFARTTAGDDVVVKVVRPEVNADTHVVGLRHLREAITPFLNEFASFDNVIEDFNRWLRRATDCVASADQMELLRKRLDFTCCRVARVYRELSGGRVLVTGRVNGHPLDALPNAWRSRARQQLAENLCRTIVQLATSAGLFPTETGGLLAESPTDLVIVDGPIAEVTQESGENLLNQLIAVTEDDAATAVRYIAREWTAERRSSSLAGLEEAFRQIAPFSYELGEEWQDFGVAGMMLAQWKVLLKHKYRPPAYGVDFLRTTFQAVVRASHLAPDIDSYRSGIETARIAGLFSTLRESLRPRSMVGDAERYFNTLVNAPQLVRNALAALSDTAADRGSANNTPDCDSQAQPRGMGWWPLTTLAAVVLFRHPIAEACRVSPSELLLVVITFLACSVIRPGS